MYRIRDNPLRSHVRRPFFHYLFRRSLFPRTLTRWYSVQPHRLFITAAAFKFYIYDTLCARACAVSILQQPACALFFFCILLRALLAALNLFFLSSSLFGPRSPLLSHRHRIRYLWRGCILPRPLSSFISLSSLKSM